MLCSQSPFAINYSRLAVTIAAESGKYIQQEVTTEPETIENPTDGHIAHDAEVEISSPTAKEIIRKPFVFHVSDEGKRLDSRKIESLTDRWDFEGEEDEEVPRIAPCVGGGVVLRRLVKPDAINELGNLLSRFSVSVQNQRIVSEVAVGSVRDEATAGQAETNGLVVDNTQDATTPILRTRRTAKKPKAQALVRCRVTKGRVQRPERARAYRVREAGLQAEKLRASMLQSLAFQQACFETDGGMMGLEFDEQVEERVEVADHAGDGDEELVDADSTKVELAGEVGDEVMIGSDVEAAMEVDDGPSNSDGDNGFVEGDSMRVEADGPQLEGNETGSPDSMDIELQCDRGKVNNEVLLDKIRREKQEITLRQTSTDAANSGEMDLGSGGALAQSCQQHAAPVSMLEAENAAASMLQGVAQNLVSTNNSEDLREARQGKRPEARAVPEEVAGPSPLPGPLTTEDGDTSDTTPPTTTPAPTLPSSLSSTPPTSPSPRNTASAHDGSPKPASAKGAGCAPKKKHGKRGCDSLGDSSDDEEEEASGGSEKVKASQGVPSTPGSGSPKLSTTRRVLLPRPARRTAPTVPDSRSSNPSPPETKYPAESSKRVQQQHPKKAEADEEIMPLKDLPDQTLTGMFMIPKNASCPLNQHHVVVVVLLDPFENGSCHVVNFF